MKNNFISFLVITLFFIGCKKEETKTEKTNPTPTETVSEAATIDCYQYEGNNNKITLKLRLNGTIASGVLTYNLSEKDKNKGFFNGTLENNVLIANYTFQSEGKESVRQVAFLLQEDKLIEGYSELTDDGTKFKDAGKIVFNSTMPLTKTNCD